MLNSEYQVVTFVNKFADTVVQDTLSRRFRNTTTRYAGSEKR